jgi:hypothetical protein
MPSFVPDYFRPEHHNLRFFKGVFFSPFIIPKIAVGKHNKTWSMNFAIEFDYLAFIGKNISHDFFLFNTASSGGVRRF